MSSHKSTTARSYLETEAPTIVPLFQGDLEKCLFEAFCRSTNTSALRTRYAANQVDSLPPPAASSSLPPDVGPATDHANSTGGSSGGMGEALRSIVPQAAHFLRDILECESLLLLAQSDDRRKRNRVLDAMARGIDPSAVELLRGLNDLNNSIREVLETPLPSSQPRRSQRLTVQQRLQQLVADGKRSQARIETALNALTSVVDDIVTSATSEEADGDVQEQPESSSLNADAARMFHRCEQLYESIVVPRLVVGETVLAVSVALTTRSRDVVECALQQLKKVGGLNGVMDEVGSSIDMHDDEDDGNHDLAGQSAATEASATAVLRRVYCRDVPAPSRRLAGALYTFASINDCLDRGDASLTLAAWETSVRPFLLHAAEELADCGIVDGDLWIEESLKRLKGGEQSASRAASFRHAIASSVPGGSSSGIGSAKTSSVHDHAAAPQRSSGLRLSENSLISSAASAGVSPSLEAARRTRKEADALVAVLEDPDVRYDANRLCDAIGQVNLWLRRRALVREVVVVDSGRGGGKAVPVMMPDLASSSLGGGHLGSNGGGASTYLSHSLQHGVWDAEHSSAYEQACLAYDQLREQAAVLAAFDELLTFPDDQFVRSASDDLFSALLNRADDACCASPGRLQVERRLDATMTVRVKLHHYSGEIRVATFPQRAELETVLSFFRPWFVRSDGVTLHYLDEGDRVLLSSQEEYRQLLRSLRSAGPNFAATATFSRTSSFSKSGALASHGAPGAGEVRVELFADVSAQSFAARKPKPTTAERAGVRRTEAHDLVLRREPPSGQVVSTTAAPAPLPDGTYDAAAAALAMDQGLRVVERRVQSMLERSASQRTTTTALLYGEATPSRSRPTTGPNFHDDDGALRARRGEAIPSVEAQQRQGHPSELAPYQPHSPSTPGMSRPHQRASQQQSSPTSATRGTGTAFPEFRTERPTWTLPSSISDVTFALNESHATQPSGGRVAHQRRGARGFAAVELDDDEEDDQRSRVRTGANQPPRASARAVAPSFQPSPKSAKSSPRGNGR